MRRRIKLLFLAGALGLALGLALSWIVGSLISAGRASDVPPAAPPAFDLRIASGDGLSLAATYWPGRRADSPAVLLLHGVNSSRRSTAATAQWLSELGFAALTIDFRGHGQSAIGPRSFGYFESRDVHAAFRWLRLRQRGARIAVIGNSMGGAASLLGPDGPVRADALILQAVYSDIRRAIRNRIAARLGSGAAWLLEPLLTFQARPRFGLSPADLSPVAALPRFRGPVMVVGGTADRSVPPDESRALFAAAREPKALWFVHGRGHASMGGLLDQAYRERVRTFLLRTIGPP